MDIAGIQLNNIYKVYDNNKASNKVNKQPVKTGGRDELSISETAREFQVALNASKQVDEIRYDKVNEAKQKLTDGTYKLSSDLIADSILAKL